MGNTSYNHDSRAIRSTSLQSQSREEIFSKHLHPLMTPKDVLIRESRDSVEHPNSIAIILALDVTASMGHIPEYLVKEGLPKIIKGLMDAGIADPQIMFLAIGDHISDRAPLQISQFESGDEELDMWLTRVWLESGGGANMGESYGLAHYFAARHTVTDAFEKRNKKGYLFTIGDERNHPVYPAGFIKSMMNSAEASTYSVEELVTLAEEKWNVFHIIPGRSQDNSEVQWKELLGEKSLFVQPQAIASKIIEVISNFESNFSVRPSIPNISEEAPDKKFL